jgi:hypothetical protein
MTTKAMTTTTARPATPEHHLERLSTTLDRVVAESSGLGSDARKARQSIAAFRVRVATRSTLWEGRAIAVTGLQGAGKTTFVRHLYGNNAAIQAFLPATIGRDEKIPILIREHAGRTVEGRGLTPDDSSGSDPLTASEFLREVRDPNTRYHMMELRVPYSLFNDDAQALLLTPGIEDQRDSWTQLAREAVLGCQQVIFVANPTQLASAEAPRLLGDLVTVFKGARLLPVLTHCDDSAGDYGTLANTFARLLGDATAESRVIPFGVHPSGPRWIDRNRGTLIEALARAAGRNDDYRLSQWRQLVPVFEDDGPIEAALSELYDAAIVGIEDGGRDNRGVDAILDSFAKSRHKARSRFARALEDELSSQQSDLLRIAEEVIKDRGSWDKFKMFVFGYDLNDKHYLEDAVAGVWRSARAGEAVRRAFVRAGDEGAETLIVSEPSEGGGATAPLFTLMFSGSEGEAGSVSPEPDRKDFATALRLVPYFAMSVVGAGSRIYHQTPRSGEGPSTRRLDANFARETLQAIAQTSESGKRLVASVVGSVVSVDLADGDPASLTALLTKAGVTVSPAMTAALGVAAVVAAVAVTLVSIRRQLGAQDLEMAAGAGLLVQSYQDALRQAGFSLFDKTMDDVEEQLDARARRFLGVDDRMNAAFRTLAAVKAARACRGQMLGSLHQLSADGLKGKGG